MTCTSLFTTLKTITNLQIWWKFFSSEKSPEHDRFIVDISFCPVFLFTQSNRFSFVHTISSFLFLIPYEFCWTSPCKTLHILSPDTWRSLAMAVMDVPRLTSIMFWTRGMNNGVVIFTVRTLLMFFMRMARLPHEESSSF